MIQIDLEDHIAAALERKAKSKGMRLEDYLASLAIESSRESEPRLSTEEIVGMIEAEASDRNPRYVGTYSRDDIYVGHD